MRYWWASQGTNYGTAIVQGSLWTCPTIDGRRLPDRVALQEMARGDVVFHYAPPAVRAVSYVDETWTECKRPDGYPAREGDTDDGWLARVVPVAKEQWLHRDDVAALITHGNHGPLTAEGIPARKYISALSEVDGRALLAAMAVPTSVMPSVSSTAVPGPPVADVNDPTDDLAWGKVRREQRRLRNYLLAGRTEAPCAVCGRILPFWLLVAAHIKPRYLCTDAERNALAEAGMLACTLGCDALFEAGYLVVAADGHVVAGRPPSADAVALAVTERVGRPCTAYSSMTAGRFRSHRDRHVLPGS